ncbi:hypothetical protein Tsubulata_027090 [Turnera subulata]|uniref:F-box/kelch-repeat protein n=1 Tax=Turnera subulata TaxID=218843 RepID=A0A9Q0G562_9ROSI|nr:hypothetical protein Tsubulata_027090 [Turnera subulata]
MGNQLYLLGGTTRNKKDLKEVTRTVRALDLTRSTATESSSNGGGNYTRGWQRKPLMIVPRRRSQAIVLGGKLYVFGGVGVDDDDAPWAEVYDPISNTWEALPQPPEGFGYGFLSASLKDDNDEEKGSVVLFQHGKVMEYHVANKCWSMTELPDSVYHAINDDKILHGPTVAIGRMFYWFCMVTCRLHGLHLDTHILHTSDVMIDIPSILCGCDYKPMLGYLGGHKFFLLHEDYDRYKTRKRTGTTLIHCLKFSVDLVARKKWLDVSLESSQSFVIKAPYMMNDCFVM